MIKIQKGYRFKMTGNKFCEELNEYLDYNWEYKCTSVNPDQSVNCVRLEDKVKFVIQDLFIKKEALISVPE